MQIMSVWHCVKTQNGLIYVITLQRQPTIWWCHQLVAHPSETVRLPWQVHERGTVYRQLSAQPPHRLLPLKKILNHFCLDCHSVCDNVYCSLTMFSALAAVCTVYCAIEIVLITLHYTFLTTGSTRVWFYLASCEHVAWCETRSRGWLIFTVSPAAAAVFVSVAVVYLQIFTYQ